MPIPFSTTFGTLPENCLALQEKLIKKIIYIERKIRECRVTTRTLKKRLQPQQPSGFTKVEAQVIKSAINSLAKRVDEYQRLLVIFRNIGDALAFMYFDKYDIKPQVFKQPAGFLSQKEGLRHELEILRGLFESGRIGILNDLTNCLRYGDISVSIEGKQYIFEIKSSKSRNSRTQRQLTEARRLTNYLTKDEADNLYGVKGEWQRTSLHSQEVHHRDLLNSVISNAVKNGTSYAKVEDGLYYVVSKKFHPEILDLVSRECKGKPIISIVNDYKYTCVGYYPFTLSIYDSEAWYNFCCGKFVIIVVVDSGVVKQKLRSMGLGIEFHFDQEFVMDIADLERASGEVSCIKVSRHFFGRIFTEFLSLDWVLREILCRFK